MAVKKQLCQTGWDHEERRCGPVDRRTGIPEGREKGVERRVGLPDRRLATNDMDVTVITGSGEYTGTINLDSAHERMERTSDFLIKSNLVFITLYNTIRMGQPGKVVFINIRDIAVVLPKDTIFPEKPELREDAPITVKLRFGLGKIEGKVNLMGESRRVDRVSDLLNYPGKKWLVVYNANYRGRHINVAMINLEFISHTEG